MLKLVTSITVLITAAAHIATAAPNDAALDSAARATRVRASDTRTATLLVQGLQRSETIRGLVNHLEQRDVIVYIETQPNLKKRLAGTLTWLTATKAHRYVRISINPDMSTDMAIATLGHELQHALEVAHAPQIVSPETLERYYRAHGDSSSSERSGWDTEAARLVGEGVRRELASLRSTRVADSIQPFDPNDWLVVYRHTRGMLPP
jgi:hypothetical protein